MDGSGGAVGFLILEAMLVATAWFLYGMGEAGRQTWMAYKYGDRDSGYQADPFEAKVWFGVIFVALNVPVFFVLLR